jgi:DNA-binding MarR family transcriptional regulator
MGKSRDGSVVLDLLGSVHVLAYAMAEIVEEDLLRDAVGGQLTLTQIRLLKLVSLPGTHTITGIAAFMGISKAAASKAADRLVRGALMRRVEGEKDRRAAHLSLTQAGKRILQKFESARSEKVAGLAGLFSAKEYQNAIRILEEMAARLLLDRKDSKEVCVRCKLHFSDKCLLSHHLERECYYEQQRQRFQ